MKYATAVIGNSSSGIIEAPTFKIPTINIGDRQKGRVRAESVIDCEPAANVIKVVIKKAMSPKFHAVLKDVKNPYEQAGTAAKILEKITLFCSTVLMKKSFYDLGMTEIK
jgi:GDP/UDP-N,N'-diacetylbacillosamine 2-epimerase (hydrolysing)